MICLVGANNNQCVLDNRFKYRVTCMVVEQFLLTAIIMLRIVVDTEMEL